MLTCLLPTYLKSAPTYNKHPRRNRILTANMRFRNLDLPLFPGADTSLHHQQGQYYKNLCLASCEGKSCALHTCQEVTVAPSDHIIERVRATIVAAHMAIAIAKLMPKKLRVCASWRSKGQPHTVVTLCQPAQGENHANATATASLLMGKSGCLNPPYVPTRHFLYLT